MTLDPQTALVSAAAGTLLATVVYSITATMRHNDRANRLWTSGFIAAFGGAAVRIGWTEVDDSTRVVRALSTAALVFAVGALWAGARSFAGRTTLAPVALTAAAVVGVLVALGGGARWTVVPGTLCTAVLALLAALALQRGPMGSNLNSRLLQLTLLLVAVGSLATLVVSLTADGWTAGTGYPSLTMTLIICAAYVVAAMALTALRVERYGTWWSLADSGTRESLGVLDATAFRHDARDRLLRSVAPAAPAALVVADLTELDELNTAFGRQAGDAALAHLAAVLRVKTPPSALLGHLGAGRFAVLTSRDPEVIVAALRTGLLDVPVSADAPMRLAPRYGTATAAAHGYDYDAMVAAATANLVADGSASI
jgi:GGDEF domain-containing protein